MRQTSTGDVVKGYIKRGLAVIPLPIGEKNPGRKNWQDERWTPTDVPRLWNNGQNVGVLCGEPSGWSVDVDCDCPEAVRLAPKFLPPSLKGGRDTVPGSHWWFQASECETKPFYDTTGKRILELRSGGCQTVVYPSVHPDGDRYQWYPDLSERMISIGCEDLRRQVNLLFTATIIARHMPPLGGRHDYANALAGFLLRGGADERLSEHEARLVLVSAWELFEDAGRDAIRDVTNSVSTTMKRLEEKRPVVGGGALALYSEQLPRAIANGWDWSIGSDEDPAYAWGEPEEIPESLPPVREFDYQMLPDAFRPWVRDVAERMQVPPDFVAAPLMVALSAVVGRSVGIRPKRRDDWTVCANLWGAIVGSPGLLKSPALKQALAPLNRLIAQAAERHEEAMREWWLDVEVFQAKQAWYESEKKKLIKAGEMEAVETFIKENKPEFEGPPAPIERRYRTNDVTTEKLGELLNHNPNGLLVYRDELVGWYRSLDRYGREGDRAFFLESWAGDQGHDVDRIGRGNLKVPALTVAILGGIQPGPLGSYVYDAGSGLADDDGLLPRFQMLVWPDHDAAFENIDRFPSREAKATAFDVFQFANGLEYETEEDAEIPYIRFSAEAQQVFDSWRHDLELEVRSGDLSPVMESHKAKYRSLMPSLALLLEIADSAEGREVSWPETGELFREVIGEQPTVVSELNAIRGASWCEYLESHARRVYFSAENPAIRGARELLKHIRAGDVEHGELVRALYRKQWSNLKTREAVEAALEVLSDYHWCRVLRRSTGGRPSDLVLLHPELRPGKK